MARWKTTVPKDAIPDIGVKSRNGRVNAPGFDRAGVARDPSGAKGIHDFLYPKMPAPFLPSRVVRFPIAQLKDRYIQVFAATMGNHSIALFYCVWTPDRFEAVVTADPVFGRRIEAERARLVDRATFLLNKNIGLVCNEAGETPGGIGSGSATLAKVVGDLKAATSESKGKKKGYKLTVDGLARPVVGALPPGAAEPPAAGPGAA